MRKKIFFLVFFHCVISIQAQYILTGSDPGNLRWRQINTPHFKIVFPKDFQSQAQRVASTFEYSYSPTSKTMSSKIRRTPVLIHSQSAVSNGITAWAPRRIEVYPMPYQDNMYCHNWYEQLAVHEFRHICQFKNFNRGATRVGNILYGQSATAASAAIIPPYFFEGDAVVTETALSRSGRGRQPWFQMETRAQLLEQNTVFSYRKASIGSYKNHIPDIYQFGYLYVASARNRYGYQVWDNTVKFVGRFPFLAYPALRDGNTFLFSSYSRSLKKNTGMHRDALYKNTFANLDTLWHKQDVLIEKTRFTAINKRYNHTYTSYRYPVILKHYQYESLPDKTLRYKTDPPSYIIAEKSGIDQLHEFVKIDMNGNEEQLHVPGLYVSDNISVSYPLIAWIEQIPDIRWEHRNYKVVKTMDVETGSVRYLSRRTRYAYPVVSPDASAILVVDYKDDHQFALTVIDSKNGKVMVTHLIPENILPLNPCWDPDGQHVYAIINSNKGKSIQRLNIVTGEWKIMFFPDYWEMYQLHADKENVYFRSGYSGIENIYLLRKSDLKVFQVTSSRFGAFDPYVAGDMLYYSDYSSDGYNVVKAKLDSALWTPASSIIPNQIDLNAKAVEEEGEVIDLSEMKDSVYSVKKYSKLTHLFNFHSWTPLSNNEITVSPEPVKVYPGLKAVSQNLLGTAVTYAGFAYRERYENPLYYGGFKYTGFFPVIAIDGSYGGEQNVIPKEFDSLVPNFFTKSIRARMSLPLNLSRGKYLCVLYPEVSFQYSNAEIYDFIDRVFVPDYLNFQYRVQFYQYLTKAYRDIFPRYGYGFEIWYKNYPFDQKYYGSEYQGNASIYFPGFANHHSLKVAVGGEYHESAQYVTSGLLAVSRGYTYDLDWYNKTRFYSWMRKITVDYVFPVLYPDVSLFDILYITRFRMDVFYDYSYGMFKFPSQALELSSTGCEFSMDFHLFHAQVPFSISHRQVYLIGYNRITSGIFFNLDILNF